MKIGFIGCGNMAKAMISGIIAHKNIDPQNIYGSNSKKSSTKKIEEQFKIKTTTNNIEVVNNCEIIFLSIKPQLYSSIINEIKDHIEKQIIVTLAPGKTINWIEEHFDKPIKIIRTAPNTPALVQEGLTGYCSNTLINDEDKQHVVSLLASFGETIEVSENLLDIVSALGGSSPAFVYMFIEALADGAVAEGLARDVAIKIASQAVLGSAKMVRDSNEHPYILKDQVCSPGGSTIKGVEALENNCFSGTTMSAMRKTITAAKNL